MRVQLKAGAELDLLTPGEARALLDELEKRASKRRPQTMRDTATGKTDASGDLTLALYQVPLGMEFALHRIRLDIDGADPGSPFTAATGWADIARGDEPHDFVSFAAAAGGLPAVYTASDAQAIRYRNGETVTVIVHGAQASTRMTARWQGTLQPRVDT